MSMRIEEPTLSFYIKVLKMVLNYQFISYIKITSSKARQTRGRTQYPVCLFHGFDEFKVNRSSTLYKLRMDPDYQLHAAVTKTVKQDEVHSHAGNG